MPIFTRESPLRSVLLVGDYGSGKTEIAVNLSLRLASEALVGPVTIADLDLVNPYFRCREASEPLEQAGIQVVVPAGGHRFADLPILLPQVKGLLQNPSIFSVLDVGGDDVGARVLAALGDAFDPARHGFWFVINTNRPFNDTVEGCLRTIRRIEGSSQLKVTGLVANTHLMDETSAEMVREGAVIAQQVGQRLGVPLCLVAVMRERVPLLDADTQALPLLQMQRLMVPPWLARPKPSIGPELFRIGARLS